MSAQKRVRAALAASSAPRIDGLTVDNWLSSSDVDAIVAAAQPEPGEVDADALLRDRMLRWRDVRDPCECCSGSGRRVYGGTSTWRGGLGGCMMTADVCDHCWGSGDRFRHGVDLRQLRDEEEKRVAERAVDLIARSVGAAMASTRPAVSHIVLALEKLADKRGAPAAPHLPELARGLAATLRRAIGGR